MIKQLGGTAIETNVAPPFIFISMDSLQKEILSSSLVKALVYWHCSYIFMMWEHGQKELQKFLDDLNCYHPTIKLTAEYSRVEIFL